MKTFVVKTGNFIGEYKLDPAIFPSAKYVHNIYLEAALLATDEICNFPPFQIGMVIQSYEKGRKKVTEHFFNTYYILLCARRYHLAQQLRDKVLELYKIDMAAEHL